MELLLFHPGALSIDCEDCHKWVYDLETGEPRTYRAGPHRQLTKRARDPGQAPPCSKCPKGQPGPASRFFLSDANWKLLRLYRELRATRGACLPSAELANPLLRHRLTLIDELYRRYERERFGVEIALQTAKLLKV